jgi:hypothetical protein
MFDFLSNFDKDGCLIIAIVAILSCAGLIFCALTEISRLALEYISMCGGG